jgi:hypothetical protein
MTRNRLIVGLITHIVIYLTVTKTRKGGQDPTLGCSAIDDDDDDDDIASGLLVITSEPLGLDLRSFVRG